ncbi:hypothetical protein TCAL_11866 [Tigriopus californicus]|uniref:SHSP domain-containing protein n=1 Tax=Tigriopus californicus TaxID=6832 RepID=A0A553PDS0_TIGCA|nr:uncharacterized protein LOC131893007 [Tigriopus californicus]TRY75826.1 hypothetical protein TCAL_11866 [Tigriopus californicus]|eukprot:TCALIF_11866-PA protein Name:"Similar to Hsp23 Heat shock protein 23 (Drosophila melanogaster)" AED:0.20 eAED:0.22 QI:0/-1/0/1/-1/1/1/0/263
MALYLPMRFDDDHLFQHPLAFGQEYNPNPHSGQLQRKDPKDWTDHGDHYSLDVKVGGFKHEDFRMGLDTQQGFLRIMANKEQKSDDGVVMAQRFAKAFSIPDDCIPSQLKSDYTDNVLHVTVPKRPLRPDPSKTENALVSPFEVLPKLLSGDVLSNVKGQEIQDKDDMFQVSMQLEDFKPEDLHLDVSPEGVLTIRGSKEQKNKDGRVMTQRQIQKSFALPKNCRMDDIQSKFSKDGKLTVVAPKDPERCAKGNRKVLINSEE